MGNTCVIGAASSTQEFADDVGRQGKIAVFDDSTVETVLIYSESTTTTADEEEGQSPPKRSKGRKGTGFVHKGDLDEEQQREVQMQLPEGETPEGECEAPARKKGPRKATGFVFKEKLEGDDGDESDAEEEEEGRRKVLFNEEVNETFWLKDKEQEQDKAEEEEHCWKRTSERKATGKAIQLSPHELDQIRERVTIEPEQEDEPQAAAGAAAPASPVLLTAPAPKRKGRKPTGRPTAQQVAEVRRQQEADEVQSPREASPSSPAPRRQRVRKDTGHPRADSKRTRVRRALGKLFGA